LQHCRHIWKASYREGDSDTRLKARLVREAEKEFTTYATNQPTNQPQHTTRTQRSLLGLLSTFDDDDDDDDDDDKRHLEKDFRRDRRKKKTTRKENKKRFQRKN